MPSSVQVIYMLSILLPGFFVLILVELLTGLREKTPLRLTVKSLALSYIVYVVYSFLNETFSFPNISIVVEQSTTGENRFLPPSVDIKGVLALFSIAVLLAIIISLAINRDWMRILRRVGLTQQSHDAHPWEGAFRSRQHWVMVKLGNGDKVLGWPKRMSGRETQYSVSLQDAHWIREDGAKTKIGVDEFLVTGDIDWIQFHKRK